MEQPGQRKVLIAVDGSDTAEYAFEWYLNNVKQPNDYVYGVVATEYDIGFAAGGGDALQISKKFTEKVTENNKLTASCTDKLRSKMVSGQFDVYTSSKPGATIIEAADQHDVDLIVLGTRGLGKIKRVLMGSVSQCVIQNCGRPVVVVPKPQ